MFPRMCTCCLQLLVVQGLLSVTATAGKPGKRGGARTGVRLDNNHVFRVGQITWSDCLVAVSNITDGIEVKISCELDLYAHRQNFTGSYLSPLNTNNIWVENLTTPEVNTTSVVRYALLLPLERNVGVLEVQYNSSTEQWTSSFSQLSGIGQPYACQTLFIQKVSSTLYSVCIYPSDDALSNMRLYEIKLNRSLPQESNLLLENYASIDGFVFTNVVYANRGPRNRDQHFVVIRDGRTVIVTPSDHDTDNTATPLEFNECKNLTCFSVSYSRLDTLLVHCRCCLISGSCTPYGVRLDIDEQHEPSGFSGVLHYQCPDFKTISVNVTSHQFIVHGEVHDLEGDGFQNGLCSGSSSAIWFAYQDNRGHVFATDISFNRAPTLRMLSENGCLDQNCNSISNVSDILMIQEVISNQVIGKGVRLNNNNSFLLEFKVCGSRPIFFATVNYPRMYQQPLSITPSSTVAPTLSSTPVPTKNSIGQVLIPVLTTIAVVLVLAVPIVIAITIGCIVFRPNLR